MKFGLKIYSSILVLVYAFGQYTFQFVEFKIIRLYRHFGLSSPHVKALYEVLIL